MAAGDSAQALSLQRGREARSAQQASHRAAAGAKGERAVAVALHPLSAHGWVLLADRHWPGTVAANIDMLLVGPGGIFVIDAKTWARPPTVVDGDLLPGVPTSPTCGELPGSWRKPSPSSASPRSPSVR